MFDIHKTVRVYIGDDLAEGHSLVISDSVHHYLKNVMRVPEGGIVRVFNGRDGEFRLRIEKIAKKDLEATIENKIKVQENPARKLHLLFPPLKKERMDFLIEKSVELGVTDLHPILTQNADTRKINEDRIRLQIIEAAEQCERMDIPALHDISDLFKKIGTWQSLAPIYTGIERSNAPPIQKNNQECAILIGPPGGFTTEEIQKLHGASCVRPVTLGPSILRAETAAIAALSVLTI